MEHFTKQRLLEILTHKIVTPDILLNGPKSSAEKIAEYINTLDKKIKADLPPAPQQFQELIQVPEGEQA
jgi:hypothetical protein